jgi:hypothetical protein
MLVLTENIGNKFMNIEANRKTKSTSSLKSSKSIRWNCNFSKRQIALKSNTMARAFGRPDPEDARAQMRYPVSALTLRGERRGPLSLEGS